MNLIRFCPKQNPNCKCCSPGFALWGRSKHTSCFYDFCCVRSFIPKTLVDFLHSFGPVCFPGTHITCNFDNLRFFTGKKKICAVVSVSRCFRSDFIFRGKRKLRTSFSVIFSFCCFVQLNIFYSFQFKAFCGKCGISESENYGQC